MQLKLRHKYFKFYLYKIKHTDFNLYSCKKKQIAEHLIIKCLNYQYKQSKLKYELNTSLLNFKYLMKTQRELTELIKYLQSTWVAIRKWQLNLTDSEAWQHQGE